MTDPVRLPYWMRILEGLEESSGSLDEVGSTHRLRYGPGMSATVEVLEAERPSRYVVRATAFRAMEHATVALSPLDAGTALHAQIEHTAVLGAFGRLLELARLRGFEVLDRSSLRRLKALAERQIAAPEIGGLYSLDAGERYRLARVLALDEGVVHLRLYAGLLRRRPQPGEALNLRIDPMPLDAPSIVPSLRASMRQFRRGQPLLGLDGGAGAMHAPFGIEAFGDAEPELIARGEPEVDGAALVEMWRRSDGGWFGSITPRFDRETNRQLAEVATTILPVASLHQLPGWRAAASDLADGRLWKARDRLQGLLRTFPQSADVLDLLGEVHYRMGDLPAAARHWFLSGRDDERWAEVEPVLSARHPHPADRRASLPLRGPQALYPEVAQRRLERLDAENARPPRVPRGSDGAELTHPDAEPRPKKRTVIAWVLGVLLILVILILGTVTLVGFLIGLVL